MSFFGVTNAGARPLLMGIVNVTPDSFSDGGRYDDALKASTHALALVEQGANIIDVGGESTRPGAQAVTSAQQIARVEPVVKALRDRLPAEVSISIDTRDADVAECALAAGATIVNDVSAATGEGMLACIAEHQAALVLMHMQGTPQTMQQQPQYDDVVVSIRDYLMRRVDVAISAGVAADRIAIDPGIGFGKNRRHNLQLLAALDQFVATGVPVLLGTSRKRFMGAICEETVFSELVGATCATTALGVSAGVRLFRVHDVKANRQAADVAWACLYPDV